MKRLLVCCVALAACVPEASTPVAAMSEPGSAKVGQRVDLDASGSTDKDKRPLAYTWRFVKAPKGSLAGFSDAHAVAPSFVPDTTGDFVVGVTVSNGLKAATEVTKTVSVVGSCVAKDSAVIDGDEGAPVPIDVRTSDGGCETSTAEWRWEMVSRPAGSTAGISTDRSDPGLVPDVDGTYLLRYSVRFGTGEFGPPNQLTVNVRDCTPVPVITIDSLIGKANMVAFVEPSAVPLSFTAASPCARVIADAEWLPVAGPAGVPSDIVSAPLLNGQGAYLTVPLNGRYTVGLRVRDTVGLTSPIVTKDFIAFPHNTGLVSSQLRAIATGLVGADERLAVAFMADSSTTSTDVGVFYATLDPATGGFAVERIGTTFGVPGFPSIAMTFSNGQPRIAFNTTTEVTYAERSTAGVWTTRQVTAVGTAQRLAIWTYASGTAVFIANPNTVYNCGNNCATVGSWNPGDASAGNALTVAEAASVSVVSNGGNASPSTTTGLVWLNTLVAPPVVMFARCSLASCSTGISSSGVAQVIVDSFGASNAMVPVATMTSDSRVAIAYASDKNDIKVATCNNCSTTTANSFTTAPQGSTVVLRADGLSTMSNPYPFIASSASGTDFVWWNDNPTGRPAYSTRTATTAFSPPTPAFRSGQSDILFPPGIPAPLMSAVVTSSGALRIVHIDQDSTSLGLALTTLPAPQ